MEKFNRLTAVAAPLPIANVDTDMVIPARFMKALTRDGLGRHLFQELRYAPDGSEREDFILNRGATRQAQILLADRNFGCGSSREHAAWALLQFGFRVVMAPSFGDIFYQNALKNGLLLVELSDAAIDRLFHIAGESPEALRLVVDLPAQSVRIADQPNACASFELDPFRKNCLLNGLDDVGITLGKTADIETFEARHYARFPWLAEGTGV